SKIKNRNEFGERGEEKKKIKAQLIKELKTDIEKALFVEIKKKVEQEMKQHYEDRIFREEASFKMQTLRLEGIINQLQQDLKSAETRNKLLTESKMTLIVSTSEEINSLRDLLRKVGRVQL
ncbi:hypothetical protein RFI_25752, partial [Reticulomyxa filosa]